MKIILLIVFIIALLPRFITVNKMGRTWDEDMSPGVRYIELMKRGDFTNPYWISYTDALPFTRYIYGITLSLDATSVYPDKDPILPYDLSYSRLLSVLFSSLGAVLVSVFGIRFLNRFVGFTAGLFTATLPVFVGLGSLVTVESVKFFFYTLAVLSFTWLLYTKSTIKRLILVGVILGLAIQTKYTNILLLPLYLILWLIVKKYGSVKISFKHLLMIFTCALLTVIVVWPMGFIYFRDVIDEITRQRFSGPQLAPPEYFFGIFLHVPPPYFFVYFLITTPLAIIIFFLIGLKRILDKKMIVGFILIAWFLIPFLQSFYSYRQNGLRYIIEIYAPLSLIAAVGFERIVTYFKKTKVTIALVMIILSIYLGAILLRSYPYYLNYYNILVGGTSNVYKSNLFPLGWWGEGLGDAGRFIEHNVPLHTTVGVQINPKHTLYTSNNIKYEAYRKDKLYEYIVVNTFSVQREFFDEYSLQNKYMVIYSVTTDGASYARIYKKKK